MKLIFCLLFYFIFLNEYVNNAYVLLFYFFSDVLGDIYLVCELMETDLSRVIRSRQQLLTEHI